MNLSNILIETLQLVQVQVQEELREREINTYQKNEKSTMDNDQLRAKNEAMKVKLMKQEYEESQLKRSIEDLYVELPQCNISPDAPLSQKFKRIVAREKYLEETIEKMEVEHKARIAKLKARAPGTPLVEREAQVAYLKGCAATIETHSAETSKLLDEATETWTTMEEIDGLIKVCASLQKNQKELDELTVTMKDLILLEHMLKMKESTKLQTELQKLRAKEAEYMQTLEPWQEQVSEIAVNINANLIEFKVTKMIVASLLDDQLIFELIKATRENVDHMTQDLVALTASYTKINTDI